MANLKLCVFQHVVVSNIDVKVQLSVRISALGVTLLLIVPVLKMKLAAVPQVVSSLTIDDLA